MSFFSGVRTDYIPGPIVNNPLKGLCEKVCIQVKKVFAACNLCNPYVWHCRGILQKEWGSLLVL